MTDQFQRFIDALETADCRPRRVPSGQWIARCPCTGHKHHDKNAGLSITEGRSQPIVTRCQAFAEHDFEAVCQALGLDAPDFMQQDDGAPGPGDSHRAPRRERKVTAEPAAPAAPAAPLDEMVAGAMWKSKGWTAEACTRLGVGWDGSRITFAGSSARYAPDVLRVNGQPKMLAAAGSKRGLWPEPSSLNGGERWLCEGEPDAVTGNSAGLPCVGVPGTNGWKPSYAKQFVDLDVIVVTDCDQPGRALRAQMVADLVPLAATVRPYELGAKRDDGYDLADALMEDVTTPDELRQSGELLRSAALAVKPVQRPLPDELVTVTADTITARKVDWLWPGRVPLGAITLLTGMPGLGKSMLSCDLAAEATRDGAHVLMVTAEDAWDFVVRPRLEAVNAVLSRVHFVAMRREGFLEGLVLPDDVHALRGLVERHHARVLVIDPLSAHLSEGVSDLNDQQIRRALAPLHRMAEATGVAVIPVKHLNKGPSNEPLVRIGGSIGIPAAARSALLMERDPDDPDGAEGQQRVLAHVKCNLAPLAVSLAYRIEPVDLPGGIVTARVKCIGESSYGGRALLGAPIDASDRSELDDAMEWLADLLASGPMARELIVMKAGKQHISDRTLRRAKERLGVVSDRIGFGADGVYSWRLPDEREAE